ncbi:MAG: hypothetical protein IKS05_01335 [Oscillospiraceae bacterium]|nr:hypothetical protein [Oscillospiraceae bacterium]
MTDEELTRRLTAAYDEHIISRAEPPEPQENPRLLREVLDRADRAASAAPESRNLRAVPARKVRFRGAIAAMLALCLLGSGALLLSKLLSGKNPSEPGKSNGSDYQPLQNELTAGEEVRFYASMEKFQLRDPEGKTAAFSGYERPPLFGDLEIVQEGIIGEDPAYNVFVAPYRGSYQLDIPGSACHLRASCGDSFAALSGENIHSALWTINSWTLEGEVFQAELRVHLGSSQEYDGVSRYGIELRAEGQTRVEVSWTRNRIRVFGVQGNAELQIYDMEALMRTETLQIQPKAEYFDLSTERLGEKLCVIEEGGETRELPVSWKNQMEPVTTERESTETTAPTEPPGPVEMTMEEIEAKLGFGYKLPDESEYEGKITASINEDLGDNGAISLKYSFDGFSVYAVKYRDSSGADAYDTFAGQWAERGSETIHGIEVRFRGEPTVPEDRGVAYWEQNGFQYRLNCETAPGTDIMKILPIFMEEEILNPNVMTPMTMEELEKRLGFGYQLPAEGEYQGEIIPMIDPSIGENGGIALEYRPNKDAGPVYVWKYETDPENDAYDTWQTDLAERGSEVIQGVEVRFRGNPTLPDYKGVAYWQQNGFQYVLTCETSPFTDMMAVLPLFIESDS